MSRFKPCAACGAPADHNLNPCCSRECGLVVDEVRQFGGRLEAHQSDDPRVFFYDFAFGDLCDLWSTYLIRRAHTRDLAKARKVDHALERLEKAILTKLNRRVPAALCETRKLIVAILPQLVTANAHIWAWRDQVFAVSCPTPEQWESYKAMYRVRDAARQQLDELVEGHTMTAKTYEA